VKADKIIKGVIILAASCAVGYALYLEYSHEGKECRDKGGRLYAEGCFAEELRRIPLSN
jgi:hypothetical protein